MGKICLKEILVVLLVKISFLILLWYVCFSTPATKQIDSYTLVRHFLGSQEVALKNKNY